MERHELSDKQWGHLVECLPPLNTGRGCKMHDRRSTPHDQRGFVDSQNGYPLARLAGKIRQVEFHLRSFPGIANLI